MANIKEEYYVTLLVTRPARSTVDTPDTWNWDSLLNENESVLRRTPVKLLCCSQVPDMKARH